MILRAIPCLGLVRPIPNRDLAMVWIATGVGVIRLSVVCRGGKLRTGRCLKEVYFQDGFSAVGMTERPFLQKLGTQLAKP